MMAAKDFFKKARYKLGMSQREFAEFLEIDYGSLSLYELGKRQPSFPRIREMAKKLKDKGIDCEYSDFRDDLEDK